MISNRLSEARPSDTKAMTARAAALQAAGKDVIVLSQGEPDFDTPTPIANAAVAAIRAGRTRYTPVAGVIELRQAICEKFKRDNGLSFGPGAVTVGCGAKQVIFNALFATLDAGDEVIVPTPCWVSYPDMVRLIGGEPVLVRCSAKRGFKLDAKVLEAALTPRTKWLILNSPNNPTGAVYSATEIEALAAVLRQWPRVLILSDDIYEKLIYGAAEFATMAQVAPDLASRTLTVNGVSKADAMTGWRIGYGVGPTELIAAINLVQGQSSSHTSSVSQYAAVEALSGDRSHIEIFRRAFEGRRRLVVDRIRGISGLDCADPDGAFYVFVDCRGLLGFRTTAGKVLATDSDFCAYLLEAGLAVVPGSSFLTPGYFRMSYASAEKVLVRACARLQAACDALGEGVGG